MPAPTPLIQAALSSPAVCLKRCATTVLTRAFSHLQTRMLYAPLKEADPEIHALIEKERVRQFTGLELIASEVARPAKVA